MKETMITFEQVEAEVRRLAAERPDFVYEKPEVASNDPATCYYVHYPRDEDGNEVEGEPEPGCIFGHAFLNLGVTAEQMRGCNSVGIASLWTHLEYDDLVVPYPKFPYSGWLEEVQRLQDSGTPWGGAIQQADRFYPLPDRGDAG